MQERITQYYTGDYRLHSIITCFGISHYLANGGHIVIFKPAAESVGQHLLRKGSNKGFWAVFEQELELDRALKWLPAR